MYDTGIENLKKAALSVRVRSYLSGQTGSELDPTDMDNPELSLDLQSLIDDPTNFEVNDGLFPELLHDKLVGSSTSVHHKLVDYSQLNLRAQQQLPHQAHPQSNGGHQPPGHFHRTSSSSNNNNSAANSNNPLAYLPQPVHGGSSFNATGGGGGPGGGSTSSSPSSSPAQMNDDRSPGSAIKPEPLDHRLDFNANTVSSSSDPGYSSFTSPSSSSSSSGSSATYSPNAYHHPHNHLQQQAQTQALEKGGGVLTFNAGAVAGAGGHRVLHSTHAHLNGHGVGGGAAAAAAISKKMKNVDKASDEYKRRRERNNIAVRKSREKAKMRSRETEERVKILSKENERLQKKIDLLTEELTFLRSFFSNVGGLPEQIHREFNRHLETFQQHHIQNGIQFPSFASFKSMQ